MPKPSPPPLPSTTALHQTEILLLVFSFLDPSCLVSSTLTVNRLWYEATLPLLHSTVHWKDTLSVRDQQRLVFDKLDRGWVKRLEVYAQDRRTFLACGPGVGEDVERSWVELKKVFAEQGHKDGDGDDDGANDGEGVVIGEDKESRRTKCRNRWPSLRTVVFSGDNTFQTKLEPLLLKNFTSSLTTLMLHRLTPGILDLSKVLLKCQSLLKLSVSSSEFLPQSARRNLRVSAFRPCLDAESEGTGLKTRIKAFRLERVMIGQKALESFIAIMPELETLELFMLVANHVQHNQAHPHAHGVGHQLPLQPIGYAQQFLLQAEGEMTEVPTMDRILFLDFVAKHCPDLTRLQYSVVEEVFTEADARALERTFRRTSSLPSLVLDATAVKPFPSRLQELSLPVTNHLGDNKILQLYTNQLTLLELSGKRSYYYQDPLLRVLHNYLCDSPLLEHFKAREIPFRAIDFQVEMSLSRTESHPFPFYAEWTPWQQDDDDDDDDDGNKSHSDVDRWSNRKVWACRRLKTLELLLDSQTYSRTTSARFSANNSGNKTIAYNTGTTEFSRRVFGYLSRVCPLLEKVWLRHSMLDLSLQGGLCYLSRCKKLEELTLVLGAMLEEPLEEKDLDWMVKDLDKEIFVKVAGEDGMNVGGLVARIGRQLALFGRPSGSLTWKTTARKRLERNIRPWITGVPSNLSSSEAKSTDRFNCPPRLDPQELMSFHERESVAKHLDGLLRENWLPWGYCWPWLRSMTIYQERAFNVPFRSLEEVICKVRPDL